MISLKTLTDGFCNALRITNKCHLLHSRLISTTSCQQIYHENRRKNVSKGNVFDSDVTQNLENELTRLKSCGEQTYEVLRKLLFQYCRRSHFLTTEGDDTNDKIAVRVKDIINDLNNKNHLISDAMMASLLEFYTNSHDLQSALDIKSKITKTFSLDSFKVFNLATLLVKNGRIDDAIELIGDEKNRRFGRQINRRIVETKGFDKFTDQSINRLLNALIDKRLDTKVVKNVFYMCIEISSAKVTKMIAGPLIKMHLINKEYDKALEEFVFIADNYRVCTWSLELMRIFIELNQKTNLETVINKTLNIYGRNNTLLDLSAAYIYNGMTQEARRHIDNAKGLTQESIEFLCDKFVRDRKPQELKRFISITSSIQGLDREKLYRILIQLYLQMNDRISADEVVNTMMTQLIDPTIETLNLLKEQNQVST
ncbi:leucine-rich PPR motif-containing protein, mitochondrial-like [Oppia nitens]|uniref:leucine-rich PPR motif-containing protein, mitochondrial-like n=1 Tax=Oppia nitens TaxID=1686743 RepID=UPI0023DBA87D|nr:leucine-rich PPR motif-containing protein, mitochondrial-like [Oppia nitens]